jgi:hypothetical protein
MKDVLQVNIKYNKVLWSTVDDNLGEDEDLSPHHSP